MKTLTQLALVALMTTTLAGCGEQIDAGHVGIRKSWGKVSAEALQPGLYFYNPFGGNIIEVNAQTTQQSDETQAYTKDIQTGTFKYTISYHLRGAEAPLIYTAVGAQWEQRLLLDLVPDTVKNVIGQWEATDLIANRSKLSPQIMAQLNERVAAKCKLAGLPEDALEIVSFALVNVDFDDAFEAAVQNKVVAVQKAEQSKNHTVEVEEEAKQTVITAQSVAESMRIKSAALAQNQNLVAWQAVEKWDGQLPNYMLGGNTLPFLNIGDK